MKVHPALVIITLVLLWIVCCSVMEAIDQSLMRWVEPPPASQSIGLPPRPGPSHEAVQ
jgi:hypothetical protein